MNLTINSLKVAAHKIGATVCTSTIQAGFVNVDAPEGMQWNASGTHALCVSWHQDYGSRPTWPKEKRDAIKDCLERMSDGFSQCDCEECTPSVIMAGDNRDNHSAARRAGRPDNERKYNCNS